MSQENVKAFFERVEADEDLRDRYQALLKGMAESNTDEGTAMAKVAQFASENGHELNSEDLVSAASEADAEELSDEELDAAAGGKLAWCVIGGGAEYTDFMCLIVGYSGAD